MYCTTQYSRTVLYGARLRAYEIFQSVDFTYDTTHIYKTTLFCMQYLWLSACVKEQHWQWRTQDFCSVGGFNKFSCGQRTERTGDLGGGSPLVRGSGGSCNLVQEKFNFIQYNFLNFWYFKLFVMTTNLLAIANVKQLRTGGCFRILLPFFRTSWGCWLPKFSNF